MEKHPQLAEKFQLLYVLQLNPEIQTHTNLAKQLGRSKQAITKWCRGSATTRGNAIPLDQVANVAKIFKVEPQWFSLPYDEFEKKARQLASKTNKKLGKQKVRISTGTLPITDLNLYGREAELKQLHSFWNDSKVNVVEIVAFGGSGKSALVNKWLSEMGKSNFRGAENVYAWSFYWQSQSADGSSAGDYFMEHALEWFGDPNPARGTPWSKASRLVSLVRNSKTLLILDGFEVLQHPPGEKSGEIANLQISVLLKEIAARNKGLCIVTTRYPITDFSAFQDGRVYSLALGRLDSVSGTRMLQDKGLKGSNYQFSEVIEAYSGHALSLSLLAGYLSIAHNGFLDKFVYMNSILEEQHNRIHVERIMGDYLNWLNEKPHLQLLTLICLLGRPSSIEELSNLISKKEIQGLTDKLKPLSSSKLRYVIKDLDDANLISISREGGKLELDCHPLICNFIVERLERLDRDVYEQGHSLIFKVLVSNAPVNPKSVQDLNSLFRAVIHGVKARELVESFNIYHEKIKQGQFLLFAKGSHYADQACLKEFFDENWNIRPNDLSEDAQAYLLTSAATNLINLGNISQAIVLSRRSIDWFTTNERWLDAVIAAAPLMSMLIASGKLDTAKHLLEELESVIELTENVVVGAAAENFRGYIAFLSGDVDLAGEKFAQSERVLTMMHPQSPAPFPTISAFYCKFLLETGSERKALERSLKTFAWRKSRTWQVAFDTTPLLTWDMLVLGLTFLKIGDTINAKKVLDEQVDLLRNSEEWLYLPTGLNSRARLLARLEKYEQALRDLKESIELSRQMGIRFGEWEALIESVHVHLATNEMKKAVETFSLVREMPGMDQYKFRDQEIAELENRMGLN